MLAGDSVPPSPSPSHRSRARLLRAALALLLLAALAVGGRALFRATGTAAGAEWIWAPLARVDGRPLAFVAVHDLTLDDLPASATLRVVADEEYSVRFNGTRLGSGSFAEGEAAQAYAVGDLLRPGTNRILVEARSSRGVGALLVNLVTDDGRTLARTDGGWWIFWQYRRSLDDLTRPIERGAQPHVWGHPPVGRWFGPRGQVERPRYDDVVRLPPRPADRVREWDGAGWEPLSPRRNHRLGPRVRFVWDQPVTGYLALRSRSEEAGPAVVYFGLDEPPDPVTQAPGAVRIQTPGRRTWIDSRPRTFSQALVVGPAELVSAEVLLVDPASLPFPLAGLGPGPGVFGMQPPRLRSAVEHEVWGDLERLESEAGGETD